MVATLLLSCGAQAMVVDPNEYNFSPSDSDLGDLDHYKAYEWGIFTDVDLSKQVITSARLTIDSINNWIIEPTDILRVHLLDDPAKAPGTKIYSDNQNPVDFFEGRGTYLFGFTDDNEYKVTYRRHTEWVNPPEDLVYDFTDSDLAALMSYIQNDGKFGFGFDPDCHFYNCGIDFEFCVEDRPVPEPATLLLLGMGVTGLVVRRFRRQ